MSERKRSDAQRASEAIELEVRRFLAQHLADGQAAADALPRDARLWEELDSLGLLDLVEYLERRFDIRVAPVDFVPNNFATVAAIVRFVRNQGGA